MDKPIKINLKELVSSGVIDERTAEHIQSFYEQKRTPSINRLTVAFGILGAILTGLGIILIIGHNWDNFNRITKTIIAFLPMLIGQGLAGYALFNKKTNIAWLEGSGTFLVFAVGACIALISQIYNIMGELGNFLFTWSLLCLPLIYALRSSMVSLLYIIGIGWYACEYGYFSYPSSEPYMYWGLLLLVFPYYYQLFKEQPHSNFFNFHSWFIALSGVICLGMLASKAPHLMWIAYTSLFGIYFLIGQHVFFKGKRLINNPFLAIGALGTIILLLIVSFNWFWEDLQRMNYDVSQLAASPEIWINGILLILGGWLLTKQLKEGNILETNPLKLVFVLFPIAYLLGLNVPIIGAVIMNLLLLLIGIFFIYKGNERNHLGVLNFGLLIIATLIICRFFDMNLSFVLRGILFVAIGVGFFLANARILKKKNA